MKTIEIYVKKNFILAVKIDSDTYYKDLKKINFENFLRQVDYPKEKLQVDLQNLLNSENKLCQKVSKTKNKQNIFKNSNLEREQDYPFKEDKLSCYIF
jgi:hypothetical protein